MNELIPAFETSLFETPLTDVGIDFLELGIDSVLQDGLLREIPIVGTIVRMCRFAQNVHDRNLLRQTLVFINEFNSGNISAEKIEKHREKLKQNPKLMEEELGRVLILLSNNIDIIKSKFEAKFYAALTAEQIPWDEFCELCDITNRLFISDIANLKEAYTNNGVTEQMPISYKYDRLISVGLLIDEARLSGSLSMGDLDSKEPQKIIDLTDVGKIFCDIAFN